LFDGIVTSLCLIMSCIYAVCNDLVLCLDGELYWENSYELDSVRC
jgi:hypothetical protein